MVAPRPHGGAEGLAQVLRAPLPLPPRASVVGVLHLCAFMGTDRQKKRDRRQTGTAETCREVLFITYVNIVFTAEQSQRRAGKG